MNKALDYATINFFMDSVEQKFSNEELQEELGMMLVSAMKAAAIKVAQDEYFANLENWESNK